MERVLRKKTVGEVCLSTLSVDERKITHKLEFDLASGDYFVCRRRRA